MNDEELDNIQEKSEKGATKKKARVIPDAELPPKMDLDAAHRKVMMIMIGIFVAILLVMLLLQNHVEFAASGGM